MRLGAFLLGGLLGATAVVMLRRRGALMRMAAFSSLGNTLRPMLSGQSSSKRNSFKYGNEQRSDGIAKSDSASQSGGLDQVGQMVKQDPQLQQQVDEILANSTGVSPIRQ